MLEGLLKLSKSYGLKCQPFYKNLFNGGLWFISCQRVRTCQLLWIAGLLRKKSEEKPLSLSADFILKCKFYLQYFNYLSLCRLVLSKIGCCSFDPLL